MLFNIFSAALLALSPCFGAHVDVYWNIVLLELTRDGYNTRTSFGVNGQSPIPPIYIDRGDTLALHVHNSLDGPTSIHFHGLYMENTPYYDGAGMVTECGIPPGKNFTYYVTPEQEGTYWVHGHYNHQVADGLRTAFIIRERIPIADYDEDLLITLEDWYPTPILEKMKDILQPGLPFPPETKYPYGLINGYNGNDTKPIHFSPGKKYRIRVLNIGTIEHFQFTLPGHKMQIIEAEGERTVPYDVDGVLVGPGQRYSVLVEAKDTDEFNYIYNATLVAEFIPSSPGLNPHHYFGLVEYRSDAPVHVPVITGNLDINPAVDIELVPYDKEPLLEPVTKHLNFKLVTKIMADEITHSILGNYPYSTARVPTIYTALTMGDLATNPNVYGNQTQAQVLDFGDIVELEFHATSPLDHTFHLHGHKFQIVEYGPAFNAPDSYKAQRPVLRSKGAPLKRDTLLVRGFQYIKIRFKADNPGVWLFHCHMDVHFYMGLAVMFIEAPLELQKTVTMPEKMNQFCRDLNVKTSGNGAGNAGFNMTGLPVL